MPGHGNDLSQRRAGNALERAPLDDRGREDSAGIAHGDKGVGLASFYEVGTDSDGRFAFTQRALWALGHANGFFGGHNAGLACGDADRPHRFADGAGLTD